MPAPPAFRIMTGGTAPDDVDALQDLVLGALQDANTALQSYAQEKMGPFSQALG